MGGFHHESLKSHHQPSCWPMLILKAHLAILHLVCYIQIVSMHWSMSYRLLLYMTYHAIARDSCSEHCSHLDMFEGHTCNPLHWPTLGKKISCVLLIISFTGRNCYEEQYLPQKLIALDLSYLGPVLCPWVHSGLCWCWWLWIVGSPTVTNFTGHTWFLCSVHRRIHPTRQRMRHTGMGYCTKSPLNLTTNLAVDLCLSWRPTWPSCTWHASFRLSLCTEACHVDFCCTWHSMVLLKLHTASTAVI